MEYIDLHSHVAWEIDDGMPSKEDALISLKNAKKDGVVAICSTPHVVPGQTDQHMLEIIMKRQNDLAKLADPIGISIYRGAEMFMNYNFINALDEHLYLTINGTKYLLCEFDVRKDISQIENCEDFFYEIKVKGMVPLLAHVERYFHNGLDIDQINEWIDMGVVMQVNRTSLLGYHGKTIQKNAWYLIENGYASIVCTDTHRSSGHRVEILSDAEEQLIKRVGKENTELLLWKNPLKILNNMDVDSMNVDEKENRKKFKLF